MIKCELCGVEFNMITNSHLNKKHKMTTLEYLSTFPFATLCDDKMIEIISNTRKRKGYVTPECFHPKCNNHVANKHNKFCSYSCARQYNMSSEYMNIQSGANNPQWTGGRYSIGKRQKKIARNRDKHTCRNCNKVGSGKTMHAHHIVPERCFDDPVKSHDLYNLVTLCDSCHHTLEWETFKEMHKRCLILDKEHQNDANFESFEDYKKRVFKIV